MTKLKLLVVLGLGIVLIGGCASTSSEGGRSSSGASSNPTENNPNASFHYPNY
jgi:PBP1b-binding outer membrane lipoprotein LpoB